MSIVKGMLRFETPVGELEILSVAHHMGHQIVTYRCPDRGFRCYWWNPETGSRTPMLNETLAKKEITKWESRYGCVMTV